MTATILLDTMEKVNTFVDLARSKPYDVDLLSGRYIINGKSIMGVFSLDLTKPILVEAVGDESFAEELRPYLLKTDL